MNASSRRVRVAAVALVTLIAGLATLFGQRVVIETGPQEAVAEVRATREMAAIAGPGELKPMPAGTGLILGQVVEARSSRAVPGALVALSLAGAAPLRVLADSQGRFVFSDLPPGSFGLNVTKSGYLAGANGRTRPQGPAQALALEDGGRATNVRISLWKTASISGTVVDEAGEAMVAASVQVLRKSTVSGRPRLSLDASDRTDDRGVYRIAGLIPGEFIVFVGMSDQGALVSAMEEIARTGRAGMEAVMAAMPLGNAGGPVRVNIDTDNSVAAGSGPDGRPLAYPTSFYPSARVASRATPIALAPGEERTGVDFQLRPLPTARVSGTVTGPTGPGANLTLTLLPRDSGDLIAPVEAATARTDATGMFVFPAVPFGDYVLKTVSGPRAGMPGNISFSMSNVNGQVAVEQSVVMTAPLMAGSAPAGRMVSPGAPPLPTEPTLWAETAVSADRPDVGPVSLLLQTGFRVSGDLEWLGAAERPDPSAYGNIGITLDPADARTAGLSGPVRGRIDANGTFSTATAVPGRYVLRASGVPRGWFFRGATFNGRDITDVAFDLSTDDIKGVRMTFADRTGEVAGNVATVEGVTADAIAVLIFPAEREAWSGYGNGARRLRSTRPGRQGAFSFGDLPPGRYHLVAIPDALAGDWQDVAFLESLARSATTVDIAAGQKASPTLKVVR